MAWNPIDSISGVISAVGSAVTKPISDVIVRREERKQAHNAANSALHMAVETNATTIELSRTDLEKIMQGMLDKSWKDEFVTVCFVGMVPAVVLGGVLQGFGFPNFLIGVVTGIKALTDMGLMIGPIMTTVVAAAVGVATLKRLL